MNKVVNVFSFVVLAIFTLLALTIIFDLSVSQLHFRKLPYQREILYSLSILFFLIGLIRVKRRWQGIKDMKRFSQFDFDRQIARSYLNKGIIFSLLEVMFLLAAMCMFAMIFVKLKQLDEVELLLVMIVVLGILAFESILFTVTMIVGGKAYRIGINDKVIAFFSREMHLFYYTGLKRVVLHQRDLISFEYKDDLVLFFPATVLESQDRIAFREALLTQLEEKNIYFDDALRNWE